jgi:maltooligosyltrehalose synthase
VEKILARHESLREDWPVQGTTGYEFSGLVTGLLIDPSGEESFSRAYTRFAGEAASFVQIVRDAKLRIMDHEIASELNVLARDASRIARQNPRTADFTHNILHRALREIVACFPRLRGNCSHSLRAAVATAQRRGGRPRPPPQRCFLVNIKSNVSDTIRHDPSPMHEARRRPTRRNPPYLHTVRRVAPYSGGHVV